MHVAWQSSSQIIQFIQDQLVNREAAVLLQETTADEVLRCGVNAPRTKRPAAEPPIPARRVLKMARRSETIRSWQAWLGIPARAPFPTTLIQHESSSHVPAVSPTVEDVMSWKPPPRLP